jgi:hypothetical protein
MSAREQMRDKLTLDRRDFRDEKRDSYTRHQVWNRMRARQSELQAQHDEAVDAQDSRRALACRMALKALEARMAKVWI